MLTPFITSMDNIGQVVWLPLGDVWVSSQPLWDEANEVWAELTYEIALSAAAAFGARLPKPSEIVALRDLGFHIPPVTLPSADMLSGVPKDQIDAFRDSHMGTLDWAKIHTQRVLALLSTWDGTIPAANVGKHWVGGAPTGRAHLMGWWNGLKFIQPEPAPGPGPHNDQWHDYATTTVLIRDSAP